MDVTQHTDFKTLMTSDGKVAAQWAIAFFGLDHFEEARTAVPNRFVETES